MRSKAHVMLMSGGRRAMVGSMEPCKAMHAELLSQNCRVPELGGSGDQGVKRPNVRDEGAGSSTRSCGVAIPWNARERPLPS